jgi:hypothetical protein
MFISVHNAHSLWQAVHLFIRALSIVIIVVLHFWSDNHSIPDMPESGSNGCTVSSNWILPFSMPYNFF